MKHFRLCLTALLLASRGMLDYIIRPYEIPHRCVKEF